MGNLRTSENTILELRKRKNAGTKREVEDVSAPETRSGKESPIKTEREPGSFNTRRRRISRGEDVSNPGAIPISIIVLPQVDRTIDSILQT